MSKSLLPDVPCGRVLVLSSETCTGALRVYVIAAHPAFASPQTRFLTSQRTASNLLAGNTSFVCCWQCQRTGPLLRLEHFETHCTMDFQTVFSVKGGSARMGAQSVRVNMIYTYELCF
jgi:hypothetical protein